MMGVGRHALDAEQQVWSAGETVSVSPFQRLDGISHGVPKRRPAAARTRSVNALMAVVIEIDIGQRGKQAVHQKAVGLSASGGPGLAVGQLDQARTSSSSCSVGGLRLLAAYAGAYAAFVASGLLALKAKHFGQRSCSSLFRRAQPDWARLHLLLAFPVSAALYRPRCLLLTLAAPRPIIRKMCRTV